MATVPQSSTPGKVFYAARLTGDYNEGYATMRQGRPTFRTETGEWELCRVADICILGEVMPVDAQRLADEITSGLVGIALNERNEREATRT